MPTSTCVTRTGSHCARRSRGAEGRCRKTTRTSSWRSMSEPPKWLASSRSCDEGLDRKSTRLNSSHVRISYAVFCLEKKKIIHRICNGHKRQSAQLDLLRRALL